MLNDEFNFLLTGAQRYAAYQKTAEAMETLIGRIRGILGVPSPSSTEEESGVVAEPIRMNAASVNLSGNVCVACGGSDLKHLPRKVKRSGMAELSTMLMIVALAVAGFFLFLTISAFIFPYSQFDLISLFSFIGAIAGGIWGNYISKTMVRRRRIRRHLPNTCYRCNACGKVFLSEK